MTVISLAIPDELESALQQIPGDVETFILDAVRKQLTPQRWASDADVESVALSDAEPDYLSTQEVAHYLSLPNV